MNYVYILKSILFPRRIFIGTTTNLFARVHIHNSGGCVQTASFRPWKLVYLDKFESREDALKRERQLKRWTKAKREALIAGNVEEMRFVRGGMMGMGS